MDRLRGQADHACRQLAAEATAPIVQSCFFRIANQFGNREQTNLIPGFLTEQSRLYTLLRQPAAEGRVGFRHSAADDPVLGNRLFQRFLPGPVRLFLGVEIVEQVVGLILGRRGIWQQYRESLLLKDRP